MKLVCNRKRTKLSFSIFLKVIFILIPCVCGKSNISSETISTQKSPLETDPNQVKNGAHTNKPKLRLPQTKEELEKFKIERSRRMKENRQRAREKMKEMIENPQLYTNAKTELMSEEKINTLRDEVMKKDPNLEQEKHRWLRGVYNTKNTYNPYDLNDLADPGKEYDGWAQAFRMLGAFIQCDNLGEGYYGGQNNYGCSRYIMWAAYVDPNYHGYGRNEYFGYSNNRNKNSNYYGNGCQRGDDGSYHCYTSNVNDNKNQNSESDGSYSEPVGKLDCHAVDTEWKLLGVYRQEFYEFFEQITKHMWYYSDYEYIVAYAGLDFLNDGECNLGGYDYYGNEIYYAPKPLEGGSFELSLYKDWRCLIPIPSEEMTYDEYFGNNINIEDWGDDDYYVTKNAQTLTKEYTMTLFNEVFEEFKFCTLCIDYPSYQDGYFNGDYGTDEDDLINQCWKFYSHDTDHCTHECIALGDAQGTITEIKYGKKYYGASWDGNSGNTNKKHYKGKSVNNYPTSKDSSKANLFLMVNASLLLCTYFIYQNAAQFRDIMSFDKNEGGGLQKKRGGKGKEKLLRSINESENNEQNAFKTITPWINKWKKEHFPDETTSHNNNNNRQHRPIQPNSTHKEKHKIITVKEKNNKRRDQRPSASGSIFENTTISKSINPEYLNTYKPPDWSKQSKSKIVVVKEMDKHNQRLHYKSKAYGNANGFQHKNNQEQRTTKETKRNIRHGKRVAPPPVIIENMPSVFQY